MEQELETYSVSVNISKNGRDYELESMIEALTPKLAAIIFFRDWVEEMILSKNDSLIIAVSEPKGHITFFNIKNNMCFDFGNDKA